MTGLLRSASEEIDVLAKKKLHRWSNQCERCWCRSRRCCYRFPELTVPMEEKVWRRRNCRQKRRDEGDGEEIWQGRRLGPTAGAETRLVIALLLKVTVQRLKLAVLSC
jgi:hypothetical protein